MRTMWSALAVSLVTVALLAPAAWAVESSITARYDQEVQHFKGRVSSPNDECVANRKVKLFKKTASGPQLQGVDRAGEAGRWDIELMSAHGKYFAVAVAYETMDGKLCARAKSRVVDVM